MVVSAALCVIIKSLVKAAVALAFTSAILTIVMYSLGAQLAAVFELSVCAGLITVIFISAISMTAPPTEEEVDIKAKIRTKGYVYLPFTLVILLGILVYIARPYVDSVPVFNTMHLSKLYSSAMITVQDVLWNNRQYDILGQLIMILAGLFGIIVLFKERDAK
jgi:NADH-quinone oxidoreductase subunit J